MSDLRFARRVIPCLIVSFAVSPAFADVKVVSKVTVDAGPRAGKSSTVTVYYKGSKMRTESDGMIQILDNQAKVMYAIDPKRKTYRVTNLRDLSNSFRSLRDVKFSSTAKVTPTGERKTIAGKSARKYIGTATIKMSFGQGTGPTTKIEMTQWSTEAVKTSAGFQQFLGGLAPVGNMQYLAGLEPVMKEFGKIKGLPLSGTMTVSSQMTGPSGRGATKITTKTEVQSITERTLDASLFRVPAGYKKLESPKLPGPRKDDGHGH